MKATETPILRFLQGPKQFVVPIFQRRYSWQEEDCQKLWDDVLKAGENDEIKWHFLGSIVYMEPEEEQHTVSVPRHQVIDGQQRLTTLSLLLLALSRAIKEDSDIDITPKQLLNYYLFNDGEKEEFRHKQVLTKGDKDTLIYLLERKENRPPDTSLFLEKNYQFFEKEVKDVDLKTLYTGLGKLMIVDIVLNREGANPQLIFESLNSTGVELTEADKIRNYVLMGQSFSFQNRLHENFWFPMEQYFEYFGKKECRKRLDSFMRDYLTLKTERIPPRKKIYEKFKAYLPEYRFNKPENAEQIVSEISRYGKHYVDIIKKEEDQELKLCLEDMRELRAEVAYPFLLEVYDYYRRGDIEKSEVIKTLQLVESYVFRRAICGLSGKFLNFIFLTILRDMPKDNENNYIKSLNATLLGMPFHRRCPKDDEFKEALLKKDIYTAQSGRICRYMLRKLENYGHKEPINVDDYTIEHVMPQKLTPAWKRELGEDFSEIHDKFLHTIGNLTLTGYNPEYSNSPFKEKRDMEKGFGDSHLFLNKSLTDAEQWNEAAIRTRAAKLAEKACKIWIYPEGDDGDLSIEEKYDSPFAQQKPAATVSLTTAKYDTSSDSTSMADWSEWEQELGWIIIEMLEYRNPSGLMIFEPRDIQDYYPRLQRKFPDNNSISETVSKMLGSLVNRGELEKPKRGEYRLVEGELLHLHLKLRIAEKELTENKHKSAELEDELTE